MTKSASLSLSVHLAAGGMWRPFRWVGAWTNNEQSPRVGPMADEGVEYGTLTETNPIRSRDSVGKGRGLRGCLCLSLVTFGLVAFVGVPRPAAALGGVTLNEVNCVGTDWVELINRGNDEVNRSGNVAGSSP